MANIRVGVNGCRGSMGQEVVKAVTKSEDMDIVFQTDLGDSLKDKIIETKAEVVVDFTNPNVRMENAKAILESGAHAVIGTTGFTSDDIALLEDVCQKYNKCCLIAPNFAIGAVLMMKLSQEVAKYMPHCEIIERHHNCKMDAPSGTAIKTAHLINGVLYENNISHDESYDATKIEEPKGVRGGEHLGIKIHSIRLQGYVASQEVVFGDVGQTLTIRHDTINRESFMPGVLMAIRHSIQSAGLYYGLESIME